MNTRERGDAAQGPVAVQKVEAEVKPWYKSKIVAVSGIAVLVFGSNFLFGWLTGAVGVSPETIDAVQQTAPQVNEVIERLKNGESIISLAGAIINLAVMYWRIFATTGIVAQSVSAKK